MPSGWIQRGLGVAAGGTSPTWAHFRLPVFSLQITCSVRLPQSLREDPIPNTLGSWCCTFHLSLPVYTHDQPRGCVCVEGVTSAIGCAPPTGCSRSPWGLIKAPFPDLFHPFRQASQMHVAYFTCSLVHFALLCPWLGIACEIMCKWSHHHSNENPGDCSQCSKQWGWFLVVNVAVQFPLIHFLSFPSDLSLLVCFMVDLTEI